MLKNKGSKDGLTWEERIRKEDNSKFNRFSNRQYIKNLKILSKWCDKKIKELSQIDG